MAEALDYVLSTWALGLSDFLLEALDHCSWVEVGLLQEHVMCMYPAKLFYLLFPPDVGVGWLPGIYVWGVRLGGGVWLEARDCPSEDCLVSVYVPSLPGAFCGGGPGWWGVIVRGSRTSPHEFLYLIGSLRVICGPYGCSMHGECSLR